MPMPPFILINNIEKPYKIPLSSVHALEWRKYNKRGIKFLLQQSYEITLFIAYSTKGDWNLYILESVLDISDHMCL